MIKIGKIKLIQKKKTSLIETLIEIDNIKKIVYVEVDKEYEKYLCTERADAFLIVLFYWAMRNNHNIVCTDKVSEDLYYQITEYLMPILIKKSDGKLSDIKIECKTGPNIDNKGAVVTGLTCGVDSFHSIINNINNNLNTRKLTHLVIMSLADSYKANGKYDEITKEINDRAIRVSKELKLPLINIESNIREIFPTPPMHTLIRVFGIYALQKLFGTYYFASGYPIWTFNINDTYYTDSARYDLLICKELSTKNLVIYSEGSQKTRIDKIKKIMNDPIVKNELHVCVKESYNCGKCSKCIRTMCALDSLNKLEEFDKVFDIKYYKENIDYYLKEIIRLYEEKDLFIYEYIDDIFLKYKDNDIVKNFKKEISTKYTCCYECYRKADYMRKISNE